MPRALLVLALLVPVARGDHEETERRLKGAKVEPELRARIHASIRRGAKWLAAEQHANGGFDHIGRLAPLCGLALQHAAVAEAQAAYRKCLASMLTKKGGLKEAYYNGTYEAGLTALLLQAEGKHEEILKKLGAAFEYGEGGAGWWNYSNSQRGGGAGNLSTSQFAVLGLWAAGRAGFEAKPEMWERHVAYLFRSQAPDGSFGYGLGASHSYPTGTFMGLANLILAERALGARADAQLAAALRTARERAEGVLARDVCAAIVAFRRGTVRDYYGLYAMEKACLFLDREEVGGVRWYVEGAEALLAAQREDGRWSGEDYRYWLAAAAPARSNATPYGASRDLEATAFALLFLLRSWETFHPTTPRSVHTPVTTPGQAPPAPAKAEDAPPPPPAGVPVALADSFLVELAALLDLPGAANDALVRAIGHVADAYREVRGSAEEVDGWRTRAEALLLRALGLARGAATRRPVHVAAASALGGTNARASGEMRRLADKTLLPAAKDDPDAALPEALFLALARLGDPASLAWMTDDHFVSGGSRAANLRCGAALRAAPRFGSVPGRLRRAVVERLVRAYTPMERTSRESGPSPTGTWAELAAAVILATQHFAADADGLPPRQTGVYDGWIVSMQEFESWWRDHDRADQPPWKD